MEFGLLGPLTVRYSGRLLAVPQGKPRAVLAVLLSRTGQVVPTDELAELIWDGSPPPSALPTLQNHVKRLRRALGEPAAARVRTSRPGYLIKTGPDELDLTRFATLYSEGRKAAGQSEWTRAAAQLQAALSLWRGRPLVDIWCPVLTVSEVPRLEEMRVSALENRIDADLHLGRHHEVIAELQQFVASERLRERARALLMLALYRAGRRADALAAYQLARRDLVTELGLEPGAELRQLHRQILAADPRLDLAQRPRPAAAAPLLVHGAPVDQERATGGRDATRGRGVTSPTAAGATAVAGRLRQTGRARPRCRRRGRRAAPAVAGPGRVTTQKVVPRQLPPTGPGFVGRRAELNTLTELAYPPDRGDRPAGTVGICVIGGSAGAGKTALAAHWAHHVADRFPDGQLYADLNGFGHGGPAEPADVVSGFLGVLGVPPSRIPVGEAAQVGLYRSLLASRHVLILLDNAVDASQVRPLLPPSPGSLVVITSRNRLTGLAAAECARLITLDPLTTPEAHELLTRRLGTRRMASEAAAVGELIQICAGLPLALAAAAGRVTSGSGFPVARLTEELTGRESPLDALDTGDAATSVRSVFSWSWRKLSAAAMYLFQQIAIHGGRSITLSDAMLLARVPREIAVQLLGELTQTHLAKEHAPGRFSIHPLLRAYAAEQPRVEPVREIARPESAPPALWSVGSPVLAPGGTHACW